MNEPVTNLLLAVIAVILAGLGTVAISMMRDTRDWVKTLSGKLERISEEFFRHVGDRKAHNQNQNGD